MCPTRLYGRGRVAVSKNIQWQEGGVTRAEREGRSGHRGVSLWFTGLSGAGKSTLAQALEHELVTRGMLAYTLDGDNFRHGLSNDLGFSRADRSENIRRVAEVGKLFVDAGFIVLCAFVSPYRSDRERARVCLGQGDFLEVYVRASVDTCRARDAKGLYAQAAAGQIADLTGVGSSYEPPESPDLVVDTERQSPVEGVAATLELLVRRGCIPARRESA
jgi:adenylylsulfate kinase